MLDRIWQAWNTPKLYRTVTDDIILFAIGFAFVVALAVVCSCVDRYAKRKPPR